MTDRAELRLVNADTGEVFQAPTELENLRLEHEELTRKYLGVLGENGRLRKQIAELRCLEPEAEIIRDILEYTREIIGKPKQHIVEGGERWEKCRARLRDRREEGPFTPEELKLAADGALLDPWYNGSAPKAPTDGRYLDAKTIFSTPERVERLRDLAVGLSAQTGRHIGDLLEVAQDLGVVNWRHLLRTCECGHRRMDHAKGDPAHGGAERCFECDCDDFAQDWLEQLADYEKRNFRPNRKVD